VANGIKAAVGGVDAAFESAGSVAAVEQLDLGSTGG